MRFFDSNVIVYCYDTTDKRKHSIAVQSVKDAIQQGDGVVSAQVFGEFFNAAVTKRKIMTAEAVSQVVQWLEMGMQVCEVDTSLVREAIAIHQRYQLRYWDSLIIAAARRMGCDEVWSEDMADGQDYGGTVVRNPFKV